MRIKTDALFQASLDDGLTTTTFVAGEHEVPDWVGAMAIKHYGAKEIKLPKKESGDNGE